MMAGGALLGGMALLFLWRDLAVSPEYLLLVAAAVAGVANLYSARSQSRLGFFAGPIAVLSVSGAAALWYAAARTPALIPTFGACCVVACVLILRPRTIVSASQGAMRSGLDAADGRLRQLLAWYGVTLSALGLTFASYFQYLTLGVAANEVGRRAVLTLAWMVGGVLLVGLARKRDEPGARDAGFAFIAVAVAKAALYDTTHLAGWMRIATLAIGALVLLAGSATVSKLGKGAGAGAIAGIEQ